MLQFSCLPGSVLLGVSNEVECKADGTFEPALSCVEESDLSEAQLGHLRKKAALMSAASVPLLGEQTLQQAPGSWGPRGAPGD